MRFLLFICQDDLFIRPAQIDAEIRGWIREMDARGLRIGGNRLDPAGSALTITTVDNELVTMRGPFTDSPTQAAGYELVDVADEAEAIEIAALHPMARWGTIEIRAVDEE